MFLERVSNFCNEDRLTLGCKNADMTNTPATKSRNIVVMEQNPFCAALMRSPTKTIIITRL